MTFSYQKSSRDGNVINLTFAGSIDENFYVSPKEFAACDELHIDLKTVASINSNGSSRFAKWLNEARSKRPKLPIRLFHLPPVVVRQLLTIEKFIPPDLRIESVYVPYYCSKCDKEDRSLLVTSQMIRAGGGSKAYKPPSLNCKQCTHRMELDINPLKYFSVFR